MLATVRMAEGENGLSVYAPEQTLQSNKHYFDTYDAPEIAFVKINQASSQGGYEKNAYQLYAESRYGHIPHFVETLRRESGYQSIQSTVVKNGIREPSYGCAQIHEPSHPTITREQAMDCIWSIDWAAEQFLKGKACMWTEYRNITGQAIKGCKTL